MKAWLDLGRLILSLLEWLQARAGRSSAVGLIAQPAKEGRWRWGKDGTAATWVEPDPAAPAVPVLAVGDKVPTPKPLPVPSIPPVPSHDAPVIIAPLLAKLGWVDPEGYAGPMNTACVIYGIRGRRRVAAFLGQVGHESGRGRYTKEVWGPTEAQKRYEGRKDLGNIRPGDGSWFRGRGLLQITGRANYEAAAKALGIPLDRLPAWLETREGAVTSAAWWWREHGCNELADKADTEEGFEALTRRINGGENGIVERQRLYAAALAALS